MRQCERETTVDSRERRRSTDGGRGSTRRISEDEKGTALFRLRINFAGTFTPVVRAHLRTARDYFSPRGVLVRETRIALRFRFICIALPRPSASELRRGEFIVQQRRGSRAAGRIGGRSIERIRGVGETGRRSVRSTARPPIVPEKESEQTLVRDVDGRRDGDREQESKRERVAG